MNRNGILESLIKPVEEECFFTSRRFAQQL